MERKLVIPDFQFPQIGVYWGAAAPPFHRERLPPKLPEEVPCSKALFTFQAHPTILAGPNILIIAKYVTGLLLPMRKISIHSGVHEKTPHLFYSQL